MTYRIKDWNKHYENNRTRDMKSMQWVPVPNKHDGDGYTTLVDRKNGAAYLGAWLVILQVASKCEPRGTLLRSPGIAHDSTSLSRMTRLPKDIIQATIEVCIKECKWMEIIDSHEGAEKPQEGASIPHPTDEGMEGNGREGIEENGNELSPSPIPNQARIVLHLLNEQTGKHFRETETSLEPIIARLSEPDVTLDGVKTMVQRQVTMWKGTNMDEYLRPTTLFNKTKFNEYYAAKDAPIPQEHANHRGNDKPNPRNTGTITPVTDYGEAGRRKLQSQAQRGLAGEMAENAATPSATQGNGG